ncbi:MAG: biotin--[acetyl-CoA-carboxylase] ligase [Rikenellaceae bacterium]
MIHRFDLLTSTNDQAQGEAYSHGDIIVAERQSAGRGQRGNRWLSGEGLNLTLSLVVEPRGIELRRQFLISQAVALAICDMLKSYGLEPRIKWTNDIYIGDEKIVGILIENRLTCGELARSVVGIGLNVNQREFDPELPNPTSMAVAKGESLDREEVLQRLAKSLRSRVEALLDGEAAKISEQYHSLLYRLEEAHLYKLKAKEPQVGKIVGVEPTGELRVEWESGETVGYLFGEIDFVIERRKR